MITTSVILTAAIILFTSIFIGRLGNKFGVPTLLLFLVVGMIFGSDGVGIEFYSAERAQAIGMLALSIILFSGGMETRYKQIKPVMRQGIVLSTLGVLITTVITGLFIWWVSGFSFVGLNLSIVISMLLAATMSSTDSASVFNLLRSQKVNLKHNLRPTLELESGSNDPMAYMLTIALIGFTQSGGMNVWGIIGSFFLQFLVGGAIGWIMGELSSRLLPKLHISSSSLYSLLLLSLVFFTFSISDILKGNGYLSVYIAGLIIGNRPLNYKREVYTFFDGVTTLSQITMFLSLGLLVNPHEMWSVLPIALLIGFFMMFVARPLTIFLCMIPFRRMGWREKSFISWVGLKGAVPIIFATYPVVAGVEGSNIIFNVVFVITLLSLLLQGTTITPLARRLHLDEPLIDDKSDFGVELPDDLNVNLSEIKLNEERLAKGNKLKDMNIPRGRLVIMIKRNKQFLVPDGTMELLPDDILLIISEDEQNKIQIITESSE